MLSPLWNSSTALLDRCFPNQLPFEAMGVLTEEHTEFTQALMKHLFDPVEDETQNTLTEMLEEAVDVLVTGFNLFYASQFDRPAMVDNAFLWDSAKRGLHEKTIGQGLDSLSGAWSAFTHCALIKKDAGTADNWLATYAIAIFRLMMLVDDRVDHMRFMDAVNAVIQKNNLKTPQNTWVTPEGKIEERDEASGPLA